MKTLRYLLIYIVLMIFITLVWQGYEWLAFGEIEPDYFHTVIAQIMSISITINIMQWEFFKKYTE